MASPDPATGIAAVSMAGILASVPLGVSVQTIALSMGFAVVGVFGRAAFDIQKALEAGSSVKMAQIAGWLGAGLVGAPFITILWVVFLRAIGAQTDIATVIGLLFLGFSGPKGVNALMGAVTDFVKARFGASQAQIKPTSGG